jgi:Papain-like cysteine protease AvrRpt2
MVISGGSMPLEELGIPLSPQKPVEKAMVACADVGAVGMAINDLPTQPLEPVKLDVGPLFQDGPQWCWAACIAMVRAFFQQPLDQCQIVKKVFPAKDPCNEPNAQRTEGCLPQDIKSAWVKSGFAGVTASSGNLLPTIENIKSDLAAKIPLQAGIQYFGHVGKGHVVVITGWSDTTPVSLHINDSLKPSLFADEVDGGQGLVTLAELNAASGFGLWAYAWRNLSPHAEP